LDVFLCSHAKKKTFDGKTLDGKTSDVFYVALALWRMRSIKNAHAELLEIEAANREIKSE
jgi:hypothetical protein